MALAKAIRAPSSTQKTKAPIGYRRLPQMHRIPNLGDMQSMLRESQEHAGQIVELPWLYNNEDYYLTAVSGRRHLSMWALYKGKGSTASNVWVYETPDVSLVHSMTLCAFPEEDLPAPETGAIYAWPEAGGETASKAIQVESINQEELSTKLAKKGVCEGDLSHLPISNLLQSLAASNMSGRLAVERRGETASVFFDKGRLKHCQLQELLGEEAFVELVAWEDGYFRFYKDELTEFSTIKGRMEGLLMEGAALTDYAKFLEGCSIGPNTVLKQQPLQADEYTELLKGAVPVDQKVQREFFQAADGTATLDDLIRSARLVKRQYLPIIHNLIKYGLLLPTKKQTAGIAILNAVAIDEFVVNSFRKGLMRKETGVYSYPAFLYFLQQEEVRFLRYKRPYSIILFRLSSISPRDRLLQAPDGLALSLIRMLQKLTRASDLLCHYQSLDFALLLPETTKAGCRVVCSKIKRLPGETNLTDVMSVRVGSATIPSDCEDCGAALALALSAREKAVSDI